MKSVSFMFKKSALLFAALLFVSSFGLFTSCQNDDDSSDAVYKLEAVPEAICGTWVSSSGDAYVISKGYVRCYGQKDDTDPNLVVKNVEIDAIDGTSAYYLYGNVESALSWTYGNMSGSYGTVGNYACFYVEVVDGTTIKISQGTIYGEDYSATTDYPTLDEAKTTLTEDNGAFGYKPAYSKQ